MKDEEDCNNPVRYIKKLFIPDIGIVYKSYFLSSSLETGYEVQFNHFLTLSVSLHNNFRSIRVFLYIICLVFHIKGSSRFHMLVSADRHFRYWENKFSTINPKKPFEKVLNFNYLLDN